MSKIVESGLARNIPVVGPAIDTALDAVTNNPIANQGKPDEKTGDLKIESKPENIESMGFDINAQLGSFAQMLGISNADAKKIADNMIENNQGLPSTIYRYLTQVAQLIIQANAQVNAGIVLAGHLLNKFNGHVEMALDVYKTISKYASENKGIQLVELAAAVANNPNIPYTQQLIFMASAKNPGYPPEVPTDLMAAFSLVGQPNNPAAIQAYQYAKIHQRTKLLQEMAQLNFDQTVMNIKMVSDQAAQKEIMKISNIFKNAQHNKIFVKFMSSFLYLSEVASAVSSATIGQGKMQLRRDQINPAKASVEKKNIVTAAPNNSGGLQKLQINMPGMSGTPTTSSGVSGQAGGTIPNPAATPQMGSTSVQGQAAATANPYATPAAGLPSNAYPNLQPMELLGTAILKYLGDERNGTTGILQNKSALCEKAFGEENYTADDDKTLFHPQSGLATPEELEAMVVDFQQDIAKAKQCLAQYAPMFYNSTTAINPGETSGDIQQTKEAKQLQIAKWSQFIQAYEQMANILVSYLPIKKEINLEMLNLQEMEVAIQEFSGGGTGEQMIQSTMWKDILVYIKELEYIADLYGAAMQNIYSQLEQFQNNPSMAQFLGTWVKRLSIKQRWYNAQAKKKQMGLMFSSMPGVQMEQLMAPQSSGGRMSSFDNINLFKVAELQVLEKKSDIFKDDEDEKEVDADARMQGYWDDLLPGYGTVLEHPQQNRKKRIKYRVKKRIQ